MTYDSDSITYAHLLASGIYGMTGIPVMTGIPGHYGYSGSWDRLLNLLLIRFFANVSKPKVMGFKSQVPCPIMQDASPVSHHTYTYTYMYMTYMTYI